jgi:ABC-type iron transport system FetAB ATPase subunit
VYQVLVVKEQLDRPVLLDLRAMMELQDRLVYKVIEVMQGPRAQVVLLVRQVLQVQLPDQVVQADLAVQDCREIRVQADQLDQLDQVVLTEKVS